MIRPAVGGGAHRRRPRRRAGRRRARQVAEPMAPRSTAGGVARAALHQPRQHVGDPQQAAAHHARGRSQRRLDVRRAVVADLGVRAHRGDPAADRPRCTRTTAIAGCRCSSTCRSPSRSSAVARRHAQGQAVQVGDRPRRHRRAVARAPARSDRQRGRVARPEALLLGPGLDDEWHGAAIAKARIGSGPIRAEDRRVGTVGRSVGRANVAYWIGNFSRRSPRGRSAGKVRLRGTFVFEKRDGQWVMAQGHLSQPIDDGDLAIRVFGTALVALDPLRLSC